MAAIGTNQVTVLYDDGSASRWTMYQLRNVTTADTLDVSNRFAIVEVATFITGQATGIGVITSTTAGIVTLTATGLAAGTVFLTVRGQASTGIIV
jgi:hypothetical protein